MGAVVLQRTRRARMRFSHPLPQDFFNRALVRLTYGSNQTMTTQTTLPEISAHYDNAAFRIYVDLGSKIEEITLAEVLAEAANLRVPVTLPLSEFAAGPLKEALQIFPFDQALAPALKQAAAKAKHGEPVFFEL